MPAKKRATLDVFQICRIALLHVGGGTPPTADHPGWWRQIELLLRYLFISGFAAMRIVLTEGKCTPFGIITKNIILEVLNQCLS